MLGQQRAGRSTKTRRASRRWAACRCTRSRPRCRTSPPAGCSSHDEVARLQPGQRRPGRDGAGRGGEHLAARRWRRAARRWRRPAAGQRLRRRRTHAGSPVARRAARAVQPAARLRPGRRTRWPPNRADYQVLALLLLQGETQRLGAERRHRGPRCLPGAAGAALPRRGERAGAGHRRAEAARRRCSPTRPAAPMPPTNWAWRWPSSTCALGLPGCFMADPAIPVTDKGGHLDANGYRWLGAPVRQGHAPRADPRRGLAPAAPGDAMPARADRAGRASHVPAPPLAWGQPFAGHRPIDVADRGFTVVDAEGIVPVVGVHADRAGSARTRPGPPAGGETMLRYADQPPWRHGLPARQRPDAGR